MATHSPSEFQPTGAHYDPPAMPTMPPIPFDPISAAMSLLSSFGLSVDLIKYYPLLLMVIPLFWPWLQSLKERVSNYSYSLFWCSLEVERVHNEPYEQLHAWLSDHPSARTSKSFVLTHKYDDSVYNDMQNGFDNDGEGQEVAFTPGGLHEFWYKGYKIHCRRYRKVPELFYIDTIELSVRARSPHILKELYAEARAAWIQRDSTKTIIYREHATMDDWRRTVARFPRPLSTVVLPLSIKTSLLADVRDYLSPATERWYTARGIPYRRGYLLYGPPGTGKSSLSFALAGVFGLKVYVLSLASPKLTEERLTGLFATLPRRCILLLEDVDAAFISRTKPASTTEESTAAANQEKMDRASTGGTNGKDKAEKEKSGPSADSKISFSALLNAIDGVASREGRILIMTTNHIEKLDPALIRPGRVDMRIEFKLADTSVLIALFKRMFEAYPNEDPHAETTDNMILTSVETKCRDEETKRILDELKINKSKTQQTTCQGRWFSERNKSDGDRFLKVNEGGQLVSKDKMDRAEENETLDRMAEEFAKKVPSEKFSPADIQGFLLRFKRRPEEALAATEDWLKEKEEERIKQRGEKVEENKDEADKEQDGRQGWGLGNLW